MRFDLSASRASRGAVRAGRPPRWRARLAAQRTAFAILGLIASLGIARPGLGAEPLYFPGQITIPLNAPTSCAVSKDISGDARLDLIAGLDDGRLLVLVNSGEGRFQVLEADGSLMGARVVELALLPLRPGEPEALIVLTENPNLLAFFDLATTSPVLQPRGRLSLPENPAGLGLGLTAPDGAARVVVTLPGIDQWLVAGDDGGQWRVLQVVDSGDRPVGSAVFDLDGDGSSEVVTANNGVLSHNLAVYRSDPDGRFVLAACVGTPGSPSALVAFDVLGDARPELFVSYADSARVSCFTASAGTFVPIADIPAQLPASGLHVARYASGELGMWTWNGERGIVNYFRNAGSTWLFSEAFFAGGRVVDGELTDLNGDRYPDLLVANGESGNLGLLFGNNQRSFRGYLAAPLPPQPTAACLTDENGDGLLDYVVSCQSARTVEILHGDGRGHLALDPHPVRFDEGPSGLALFRADGDTLNDLAVTLPGSDRVVVLLRRPDGGHVESARVATGSFPFKVVAGDLDHDGIVDLLAANLIAQTMTAAYGAGDGTFPDVRTVVPMSAIEDFDLVDLTGDGLPEIVAVDGHTGLFTQRNLGGRAFGSPMFYGISGQPESLASGDLDGDGDADLVIGQRANNSLTVLENRGTGFLIVRLGAWPLAGPPGDLAVADLNLDGTQDIAVAFHGSQEIALILNSGGWALMPPRHWVSALGPGALGVGDMNGDTVPDLVLLDLTLELAVTMLNVRPNPVPVTPPALAVVCVDGVWEIRLSPPAGGGWALEVASDAGSVLLAADGAACHGQLARYDAGWQLRLTAADWGAIGLDPGGAAQLRLCAAEGGVLLASAPAPLACLAPEIETAPGGLELLAARPNPFNPCLEARFRLPRAARVRAAVHDVAGRLVAELEDRWYPAGEQTVRWDGRADAGPAGAGVYMLTITTEGRSVSRKVTLIK